jgi:FkbH-like protein
MPKPSSENLQSALAEFMSAPTYQDAKRLLRQLPDADDGSQNAMYSRHIKVALGGNCNMDFVRPALISTFAAHGFDADCLGLEYDGWIGAALKGEPKVDWWVIWLSAMGASRGGIERREFDQLGLKAAADAIESRGERLLIILPEALRWEDAPYSPFSRWRQDILAAIGASLPASTISLSVENIQRGLGSAAWSAPRYWTLAKCPCHPDAAAAVGVAVATTLTLSVRPHIKAIVTDLDNTLWGGVVGDDGPENLSLDPDGEGRPFLEMQRLLKDLAQSGIPICVASKNDHEQAQRPFNERAEMILELSDIVYFHASWNRKYEAIRAIAQDLNLGLESICFIDDSPHERHEARNFLPELIVPELPAEPEDRVAELLCHGLFGAPSLNQEDEQRVQMYRDEVKRKRAAVDAVDYESYLKSLDMQLSIATVSQSNLSRVASLIQKTNQFNLTNQRLTEQQIAELSNDPDAYAACFALHDRFGDTGIIGVLLGRIYDTNVRIEEWVLSCRVFGRGVEDAMFAHLIDWMENRELVSIEASYRKTAKNGMLMGTLERLGVVASKSGGDYYRWDAQNGIRPHHFMRIEN